MKKILLILLIIVGIFILVTTFYKSPGTSIETISEKKSTTSDSIVLEAKATYGVQATGTTPVSPDGPDSHWFYSTPVILQKDVVVTGFSVIMEGADKSTLHHTSVGLMNVKANVCTEHFAKDGGTYEIYSASRNTLEPINLPAPYGIFLKAGDVLVMESMIHTQASPHGSHALDEVISPTLVVTLKTATDRTTPVSFARLRLDDSPCQAPLSHQAFKVPTNKSNEPFVKTSKENEESALFTFLKDTKIVTSGANFWPRKGGENVEVLLNNEVIYAFEANPGQEDHEWNIPHSYKQFTISAGDGLSIQSTYTNDFGTPILDASGMYGFYFITAGDQSE